MSAPLLEIDDLHLSMTSFDGEAHVLNGVDLAVKRGEIWGLVGETGCGKSLTGLSVSRLVPTPPGRYLRGRIRFDGTDLLTLPDAAMRAYRGTRIGMIFQDPTTNLNPAFRIGEQLEDVARAAARRKAGILDRGTSPRRLAGAMLEKVGIPDAGRRLDDWPHQFSGGMRQRVLIAMALVGKPDLLIADEPTTALDVTVQAQILSLIKAMVADYGMGVVLITHNLGVVAQSCTHVAVMYAGNIVESGPVRAVLGRPAHPYTVALMQAIPARGVPRGGLKGLAGTVPNLVTPPPGCRFAPRCAKATGECARAVPLYFDRQGQRVACLYPEGF